MLRKLLIAATFAAACSYIAPVQADSGSFVLDRIKERGVINMGHRESSVPHAYIGPEGKPIGYTMDLCHLFVDAIEKELDMKLEVKYVPVTSQTRIALMANGTIDMECGSTTNTLTRQKQVDYLAVTFITGTKLGVKKGSGIKEIEDLDGKVIAVALGTTNQKAIQKIIEDKGLKIKIIPVKEHPQGWLAVETGRADAYATDDALLFAMIRNSKDPDQYEVTGRFLSYDPYGIMVPRNDSTFRRLGNVVLADLMRSGEILKIYDKWFNPGPTNIQIPISETLKTAFEIQALPE